MIKTVARYSLLVVLAAILVAGILWARKRAADEVCEAVEVELSNEGEVQFVTEEGVLEEMSKSGFDPIGKPLWQTNTAKLEEALRNSEYLEDVECVVTQEGKIVIKAKQIVPVMRIFEGNNSYYVNKDGKRMTATSAFSVDVPLVQGDMRNFDVKTLVPLVTYIDSDSTLHSLVTSVYVKDANNIYIMPSISKHIINLGSVDNYASKFEKLKLFYEKVMPEKGWETYDVISLKWDYQVVARLRGARPEPAFAVNDSISELESEGEAVMLNTKPEGEGAPEAKKPDNSKNNTPAKPAAQSKPPEKKK